MSERFGVSLIFFLRGFSLLNISERIRFFRKKKGLSLKQLGLLVGFPEKCADVRIAQYESGTRKPKESIVGAIAKALNISPLALSIPEIGDPLSLLHLMFALEDTYGEWVEGRNGAVALNFDPYNNKDAARLYVMLCEWRDQYEKMINGKITREEYDNWRYNYSDTAIDKP